MREHVTRTLAASAIQRVEAATECYGVCRECALRVMVTRTTHTGADWTNQRAAMRADSFQPMPERDKQ
uniref:Uncharacterized protein n=1 Tax=Peronospora matthiolae TaxID=2874970 RepID=A0AAV1UFN0_9STRA